MTAPIRRRSALLKLLWGLSLALAALVALLTHSRLEGQRELRQADALLSAGNLHEAALHAQRAAAWYVPGGSHVELAYGRLATIARLAEAKADSKTALYAWRSMRSAALSSRWLWVPHQAELAQANSAIARLSSSQSAGLAPNATLERELLHGLAQTQAPSQPWASVAVVGFALLCAGLVHMALQVSSFEPSSAWRRLRLGGLITIAGLVVWGLSLWKA